MGDIKLLLKEARKLIDEKKFKEAQECCKDILRKDKQNYLALVLLGKSFQDTDPAPLAFQKAITIEPSQPLAFQGLANYYERKEDNYSKIKLISTYGEMLKLQMEDEKIIEILKKLSDLGCFLKNSDSMSAIINFVSDNQKSKLRDVAEKQLIKLLQSDVLCKSEEISVVTNILHNINTSKPDDIVMILICKVLLQKSVLESAVEEIIKLDFFAHSIEVKNWLCEYLCEFFIKNNSFNGLDINKYIDIIEVGIETSKYLHLLKSMILFDVGLYLEAYKKCIPVVNFQEPKRIEAIYIINCTVMLKKWTVTQKLVTNFLLKFKDLGLKTTLQKILLSCYIEQQNWKEAISVAKQIPADLFNPEEFATLAKCYIEANEPADDILKNLDDDQFSNIQVLTLLKQEKYEEAIGILQHYKEDSSKYYYLGKAYWCLREYDSCLENLLKSAKINSKHADTFYFLGLFYDQYKNDLPKAKKYFEIALSLCNNYGPYVKNLSEVYVKMGLVESDFELLTNANEIILNKETWLNLRLGLHYLKKKEWENAIINFREVVKISQNNLIALECLADAYFERGSYTSALRAYNKVLTLNPHKTHYCYCHTNIGNIYALLTRYEEAISTFERVFEIDPYYLMALKGVVETLLKIARKKFSAKLYGTTRDNVQAAIDYLSKALLKEKKFLCFWHLLADALMIVTKLPKQYSYIFIKKSFNDSDDALIKKENVNIFPQAIACYSYVSKLRQQSASYNLAYTYFEYYIATKELAHCHIAFNLTIACIKEKPTYWRNWNLLGTTCVYLKRYDLAQHCFIKALTVTQKWSKASIWCNLGTLYLQLKVDKLANYCFWRGQSTLPSHPQSWIGQALIAEAIRKEEDAFDLFRHACRLGYNHLSALCYADWVCRTLKNLNWKNDPECKYAIEGLYAVTYGIDLLVWYLTFEPNDSCACNMLGTLQEKEGLLGTALKSYEKAYKHADEDKKNIISLNMARVLLRLERYEEAIIYYQGIGEASLDSSCGLALALYKTGQYEDSYSAYDMALQWLCNDDADKAELLVAMAAIVYMFKGKDDAKTLLFHSIQASQKKPTPYSLFSLCSLGVLYNDQSLTMSALSELRKYEKDTNFAFDIGFLKSYAVCNEDIELAIKTIGDTLHNDPGNGRLWFCMSQYCLRASQNSHMMASVASCSAQRAIHASTYDDKNAYDIGKMFAIASIAENIAGDRDKALKLAKKGLRINPCQSELWATLLFSLLSDKKWLNRKDWLLGALERMRKHLDISRPLNRWVILLEKKLTK